MAIAWSSSYAPTSATPATVMGRCSALRRMAGVVRCAISRLHEHWVRYCAAAGVDATLHQLRHTHATELVNAGVSLATIRKRLGHRNLQTTLRYAEQSDAVADAELRAWRRRASQGR